MFVALVLPSRPEEPTKAVALRSRHDVHVEMGDALTHGVVHRHERALCSERRRKSTRDALNRSEQGRQQIRGEIGKGDDVTPRHDEDMPFEQWRAIEEGEMVLTGIHDVRGLLAVDHSAEDARRLGSELRSHPRILTHR